MENYNHNTENYKIFMVERLPHKLKLYGSKLVEG